MMTWCRRKWLTRFLKILLCLVVAIGFNPILTFNSTSSKIDQNYVVMFNDSKIFLNEETSTIKSPYEYTNEIAKKYLWRPFSIGFLILGTIGNILSLVIVSFFSSKFQASSPETVCRFNSETISNRYPA